MCLEENVLFLIRREIIIKTQSYLFPLSKRKETMQSNELLNKYQILQLLHRGIGGDVWLAEHKALGCKRVLKVIEKSNPHYELLAREAKILQQCQHSSIPIIYDILEFDTQTYIVEEFIQGENLKQYIKRQRSISASLLLDFSIQLCDILTFLHNPARNILHLDLKPENILVRNHKLKLIDFGSAICLNRPNSTGLIFGTPAYCAPEMKTMGRLTEQTDIYCMGKCMEYLVRYTPKTPTGYRNIVSRCLRKKGKEYVAAEQIRKDLEKISRRKVKEKNPEKWYAVTGAFSEEESSMAALQLAMYLRDRYKKPVLYLDCTKSHQMEQLEHSEKEQKETGDNSNNFVLERGNITVVKRVVPQELGGWHDRGFTNVVVCFGKENPLRYDCPYLFCVYTGAVTEFNLDLWRNTLLSMSREKNIAVALTGGDIVLAKKEFGSICRIKKLPSYCRAFGQSKPFKRQMKVLLDK